MGLSIQQTIEILKKEGFKMEQPNTTPKPFVFVLMPFSDDFNDVYQLGIKAACQEANAYCERVDEQHFQERILDRIYNQIFKADILIADMTGKNANVFYEVGYAHGLGKHPILLTQNSDDIPFDFKHFPHIIYAKSISKLKDQLKARINYIINNNIEFYIDNINLKTKPTFEATFEYHPEYKRTYCITGHSISIKVDIHNPNNTIYKGAGRFGFIIDNTFVGNNKGKAIVAESNGYLHHTDNIQELFPKSWDSIKLDLLFNTQGSDYINTEIPIILRHFTEIGTMDYPFHVKII